MERTQTAGREPQFTLGYLWGGLLISYPFTMIYALVSQYLYMKCNKSEKNKAPGQLLNFSAACSENYYDSSRHTNCMENNTIIYKIGKYHICFILKSIKLPWSPSLRQIHYRISLRQKHKHKKKLLLLTKQK